MWAIDSFGKEKTKEQKILISYLAFWLMYSYNVDGGNNLSTYKSKLKECEPNYPAHVLKSAEISAANSKQIKEFFKNQGVQRVLMN